MATRISIFNPAISPRTQRNNDIFQLEVTRLLLHKQLEMLDSAIEVMEMDGGGLTTESEFNAFCAQLETTRKMIDATFAL